MLIDLYCKPVACTMLEKRAGSSLAELCMKNLSSLSRLLPILLILSACNYERTKNIEDPATTTTASRFAVIQKNIIEPKCLACHSANNPADGINLSTYADVMNSKTVIPGKPQESKLFTSVANGRMPRGRAALPTDEIQLIQKWITDGAHEVENEVGNPVPAPEAVPTYQWISKNVLEKKCLICHNTAKPRGKVDLSSYEALMASTGNKTKPVIAGNAEASTLYLEIEEQKMPPNIKKLDEAEMKALHDWILVGAPAPVVTPAPSPVPGPSPTPTPPEPTYAWLSKNVLSRRCGSCHGIPYKLAKIDFTSYETLLGSPGKNGKPLVPSDPEHSTIYTIVQAGHMPPPRKEMTEEEIRIVKQWINEGAKNN